MAKDTATLSPAGATDPATSRELPTLSFDFDGESYLKVEVSGDFKSLSSAIGNDTVLNALISQIAATGSNSKQIDEDAANFALAFLDSMAPRDAAEALLCTQMAAIHQATMTFAGRLNRVENIPQQDSAERALNKLARTFAAQMDTLKRYRSKGQQTVRVERVTVQNGGQAIVGTVEAGGRGRDEN